jgi:hypothetical protein
MNRCWLVLAAAIGATACGGDNATGPVPTDQLHFLRVAVGVPALANPTVSFWAYYDHDTQARIVYHALPSLLDSATLVDFTVPSQSISELPDGSPLGPGDSVLVTMTVIDPVLMIVRFEPSGLQFSASNPAQLRLALGSADPDFDGDGSVNAQDDSIEARLHIWRQENTGDPWTQLPSTVDVGAGVVAADISGFTHYAVAY